MAQRKMPRIVVFPKASDEIAERVKNAAEEAFWTNACLGVRRHVAGDVLVTVGWTDGREYHAIVTEDESEVLPERAAVIASAKTEWASDELTINETEAVIDVSKDDDKTVNGYWVEAYVYVSAEDVNA